MKYGKRQTEARRQCPWISRKFFGSVLIILTGLVSSCQKTDIAVTDPSAGEGPALISFSLGSPTFTGSKAALTPENFAKAGNKIKVYDRYTTHENLESVTGSDRDQYIDLYINGGEAVYRDPISAGSASHWNFTDADGSAKDYYWTATGTHHFTAFTWEYSNGVKTEDGEKMISLKDCVGDRDIKVKSSDETDPASPDYETGITYNPRLGSVIIKDWELSQTNQFDFCYATHTRKMDDPDEIRDPHRSVELQMKHLFAAVQFRIMNLMPYEIKFNSLNVSGMYNTGSVTIGNDGNLSHLSTDNSSSRSFAVDFGNIGYTLQSGESYNVFANNFNDTNNSIGTDGCILIWPHTGKQLQEVTMNVYTSEKSQTGISLFIDDQIERWEAGRKYIYTINIADNKISFSAEVVPWINDDIILEN